MSSAIEKNIPELHLVLIYFIDFKRRKITVMFSSLYLAEFMASDVILVIF